MINKNMQILGAKRSVIRELFEYGKLKKAEVGEENVFDFSLGNPSVPAPDSLNDTIRHLTETEDSISLHGYTSAQGDSAVREAISDYINKEYSENTNADCIYMTSGAAAALTISLKALVCPSEEVIVTAPYFPEYKVFTEMCGAKLVCVEGRKKDFYPDIEKIRSSINHRTAAVIINSPNNPTGAIYDEETIEDLCKMLNEESKRLGKVIYLISDEPYRELTFDSKTVPFVTKYYDNSVVCYSFSKSLSIPGERIGYILISPRAEDFCTVKEAIFGAGRALGYVCAPSLLQKTVKECFGEASDIRIYEKNRDILLRSLTKFGYEVVKPEGAFYLFIKSPFGSGEEFSRRAKEYNILIVPSEDFGVYGYARLAYCTETDVIERSLPSFKKLIEG